MSPLLDNENMRGQKYECVRCGLVFDGEELVDRTGVRCPDCGYHAIKKVKAPVVRRIKAI